MSKKNLITMIEIKSKNRNLLCAYSYPKDWKSLNDFNFNDLYDDVVCVICKRRKFKNEKKWNILNMDVINPKYKSFLRDKFFPNSTNKCLAICQTKNCGQNLENIESSGNVISLDYEHNLKNTNSSKNRNDHKIQPLVNFDPNFNSNLISKNVTALDYEQNLKNSKLSKSSKMEDSFKNDPKIEKIQPLINFESNLNKNFNSKNFILMDLEQNLKNTKSSKMVYSFKNDPKINFNKNLNSKNVTSLDTIHTPSKLIRTQTKLSNYKFKTFKIHKNDSKRSKSTFELKKHEIAIPKITTVMRVNIERNLKEDSSDITSEFSDKSLEKVLEETRIKVEPCLCFKDIIETLKLSAKKCKSGKCGCPTHVSRNKPRKVDTREEASSNGSKIYERKVRFTDSEMKMIKDKLKKYQPEKVASDGARILDDKFSEVIDLKSASDQQVIDAYKHLKLIERLTNESVQLLCPELANYNFTVVGFSVPAKKMKKDWYKNDSFDSKMPEKDASDSENSEDIATKDSGKDTSPQIDPNIDDQPFGTNPMSYVVNHVELDDRLYNKQYSKTDYNNVKSDLKALHQLQKEIQQLQIKLFKIANRNRPLNEITTIIDENQDQLNHLQKQIKNLEQKLKYTRAVQESGESSGGSSDTKEKPKRKIVLVKVKSNGGQGKLLQLKKKYNRGGYLTVDDDGLEILSRSKKKYKRCKQGGLYPGRYIRSKRHDTDDREFNEVVDDDGPEIPRAKKKFKGFKQTDSYPARYVRSNRHDTVDGEHNGTVDDDNFEILPQSKKKLKGFKQRDSYSARYIRSKRHAAVDGEDNEDLEERRRVRRSKKRAGSDKKSPISVFNLDDSNKSNPWRRNQNSKLTPSDGEKSNHEQTKNQTYCRNGSEITNKDRQPEQSSKLLMNMPLEDRSTWKNMTLSSLTNPFTIKSISGHSLNSIRPEEKLFLKSSQDDLNVDLTEDIGFPWVVHNYDAYLMSSTPLSNTFNQNTVGVIEAVSNYQDDETGLKTTIQKCFEFLRTQIFGPTVNETVLELYQNVHIFMGTRHQSTTNDVS